MRTIALIAFLVVAWPIFAAIILFFSAILCAAVWVAIPFCYYKPDGGGEFQMRPFWIEDSDEPA